MKESAQEDEGEKEYSVQGQQLRIEEGQLAFARIRPYWNSYFTSAPPDNLNLTLPLHKLIFAFKCSINKPYFSEIFTVLDYDRQFYEVALDYKSLYSKLKSYPDDDLSPALQEIFAGFQCDAPAIIQSVSLILHAQVTEIQGKKSKKVCLTVQNYPESDITDIKAHMIENFITFEAVVLKVYQIKLMSVSLDFECADCKSTFTHYLVDGNYSQPNKCKGQASKDCKGRNFIMRKEKVKTIFMQRIKVQEIDSEGRTPRQIMCELRENMVGRVITGETIKISGIIKTETSDEKDKKTQGIFIPYILVNSITQKTNANNAIDPGLLNQMKSNPNLFYSLIKSFCPTIYGHQIVKAGLLLGILGGSSKNLSDESTFRETSHVLLLGDPGIGKSQLLKFAVEILPHSIYVNATATSTSGLTVTVNKDSNNDQSLEAGALILADNGVCAIDEFDKISDSSSLLEVMEQQTVSVAKAGVICQLKCRVGVIASANPVNGCYNKAKTFKDNTKISNAILSRFDLIFLLVDKPDPERDRKLAEHIMKIHNNKRKKKCETEDIPAKQQFNFKQYSDYLSLAQKYSKLCQIEQETYSLEKIKKYLSYTKQEVHPTLTREACEIIKGFYIILRENCPNNSFQITNRHLQSMVRLAMARARIECRTQVTEEDAIEITQLMQESLFDSFEEMGYNVNSFKYEAKRAKIYKKNSELSLPKQRNLFIETLREKAEEKETSVWQWSELVKIAKELELNIGDFYAFIERLNQDGILLQKGNKKYAFKDTFV